MNDKLKLCLALKKAGWPQPKSFDDTDREWAGLVWLRYWENYPEVPGSSSQEIVYGAIISEWPDDNKTELVAYQPTITEIEEAVIGEANKKCSEYSLFCMGYNKRTKEWEYGFIVFNPRQLIPRGTMRYNNDYLRCSYPDRFTAIAKLYLKIAPNGER